MSASLLLRRGAASAARRTFSTSAARPSARIFIIGNLGDAPELHQTPNGRDVVRYVVASASGSKEHRHTSWFRVSCFTSDGPRRDFMLSLRKGTMVHVDGDITVSQYQDTNGNNQRGISINQRSIEILRRPHMTGRSSEQHQEEPQQEPQQEQQQQQQQ